MKNYLIIGGSSGIGLSLAGLLKVEHNVYATYHTNKVGDDTIRYFYYEAGGKLDTECLPEALDGLVYCPGSILLRPIERLSSQSFVDDFKLQVGGAIDCIQAVLPRLKKSASSSVVLFSTVAVQSGFNFHSMVSASKGAIEGLSRALAAEFAPHIRVNCIAPSLTHTPLAASLLNTNEKMEANAKRHPLRRVGRPEDTANLAAFLLSEKSSWITGQVIHSDGGMSSINV